MKNTPRWLRWVALVALLWNLLGLAAVAADSLALGPALSADEAAYAASIAWWAKAGSWLAVLGGTVGSALLLARRAAALPAFLVSLAGLVAQDLQMFVLSDGMSMFGSGVAAMQAMVVLIAVGLALLALRGRRMGWLT